MKAANNLVLLFVCIGHSTASSPVDATGPSPLVWSRDVKTSGIDFAGGVTTDGSGNVYISGEASGLLGQSWAGGYDAFVGKFDPSGELLWLEQFGTTLHESAPGIDATQAGDVVVVGTTERQLGSEYFGAWDGYVRKYNAAGTMQWTLQIGTVSFDTPYNVDLLETGEAFVAGYVFDILPTNARGFVTKVSADGAARWSRNITAAGGAYAFGVAADPAGNAFVVGESVTNAPIDGGGESGRAFLAKLDVDGNFLWSRQFGDNIASARDVAVDLSGNAYIAGPGGFVRKYDPFGSLLWSRDLDPSISPAEISLDGQGLVVVSGVQSNGPFYRLYDTDGALVAARELGISSGYPAQSAADGNGYIYLYQTVQFANSFDTTLFKHTVVPEPASFIMGLPLLLAAIACFCGRPVRSGAASSLQNLVRERSIGMSAVPPRLPGLATRRC
jgi:hypothetical protein